MSSLATTEYARRAGLALQGGDRREFIAAMRGLVSAKPSLGDRWLALAQPLADYGEIALARAALTLYVRAAGYQPMALFQQAMLLAQMGCATDAAALLPKIGRQNPDPASNAYFRGTLSLNMGDLNAARGHLIDAATIQPGAGQIWRELASLGSMATDAELGDLIHAQAASMMRAPEIQRAPYLYAVGKTHHDRGETDHAFAAYAEGAAIVARQRPYSMIEDRRGATMATAGWDMAAITAMASRVTIPTDRPIIVTGSPRSGSTLVEQILASHSAVVGGEELGRFALVVAEIGDVDRAAALRWIATHDPDEATGLYLHLLSERFGPSGRIVDKTLNASRYLGVLAAILPEAPIIWMRRDPLDTAWSCFRTWFATGVPWSWSLPAIATHFRLEDELLSQWQKVLGDRLMIVKYEDLVSDKAAVIPTMLAHCGLAMEEGVLSPERTLRLVTTNSAVQVREPINADAIDAAARYSDHLRPFLNTYQST